MDINYLEMNFREIYNLLSICAVAILINYDQLIILVLSGF